jgi:hypothetical protein
LMAEKATEWNEKHPDWLWALDSGVWYGNFEHGMKEHAEWIMKHLGWKPPEPKEGEKSSTAGGEPSKPE